MKRLWLIIALVCGVALLGCALLVPAHLRAVDAKAIERAGLSTPSLVEEGQTFVSLEKIGPARMLAQTAQSENVRRHELVTAAVALFSQQQPELVALGGSDPALDKLNLVSQPLREPRPIVDLLMRRDTREKLISFLQTSRRPGVQQILRNRSLTNTTHFPPAMSSSGQAIDAAIAVAGALFQGDHFMPSFRDAVEWLAMRANKGDDSSSLELVYLDILSLGRRLDWVTLTAFVSKIEDLKTLRDLAEAVRTYEEQVPLLCSAVLVSGKPGAVAKYLTQFSETGLNDLAFALRTGTGGLELLLKQQQRIYTPGRVRSFVTGYDPFGAFFYSLLPVAQGSHAGALLLKYLFVILASVCIARSMAFIVSGLELPIGIRLGADGVLTLAIAFVLSLFFEPFIGVPSQALDFPIRFQLPMLGGATASKLQHITRPYMNQLSLIALVVFFVLQALIYVWCLTKLAEIRRQPLEARMKLRLLENEDHLFDAGLYFGFVGTVISLILISIGVVRTPSAMMAYSSTSFGIIFVSVLKIFHIRPLRRKLILESEAQ